MKNGNEITEKKRQTAVQQKGRTSYSQGGGHTQDRSNSLCRRVCVSPHLLPRTTLPHDCYRCTIHVQCSHRHSRSHYRIYYGPLPPYYHALPPIAASAPLGTLISFGVPPGSSVPQSAFAPWVQCSHAHVPPRNAGMLSWSISAIMSSSHCFLSALDVV